MRKNKKGLIFLRIDVQGINPQHIPEYIEKVRGSMNTEYIKEHFETFIFPENTGSGTITPIVFPSEFTIVTEEQAKNLQDQMEEVKSLLKEGIEARLEFK